MTHDELTERAKRWLAGRMRCRCVLIEAWTEREIADAIGWTRHRDYPGSHLVEVKTSASDFCRDQRKHQRTGRQAGAVNDNSLSGIPDRGVPFQISSDGAAGVISDEQNS